MERKAFIFSIILNVVLLFLVYNSSIEEPHNNNDLFQSKGRVEILEEQLISLEKEYTNLKKISDSLSLEIDKKPKERIIIKKIYDEKILDIINISLDSNVKFLSRRLSEIDYN